VEFDAEEVEEMRRDDIRQCTRDLLLVERARECGCWESECEVRGSRPQSHRLVGVSLSLPLNEDGDRRN
jgi:hypothetical protein